MKLLVCLSFSPSSELALRYALQFAAQVEAELTVLHVYPDRVDKMTYLPEPMKEALIKDGEFSAQKHFLKYLKHLRTQVNQVVSVHPLLRMGKPVDIIPRVGREIDADIILIGMNEKSRTSLRWKGGLLAALYQESEVPLLMIPESVEWRPVEHLVYGTRFDEAQTRLPKAMSVIARDSEAHISCVNVATPKERNKSFKEPMLEKMYRLDLDPSYQVCFYSLFHKSPALGLKTFTELYKTDMFGLLYLRKRGFGRLFQRSLARKMLYELPIPVLVIPQ